MNLKHLERCIDKVCSKISPSWSLENSVAVNPFHGISDTKFTEAAVELKYRGGINLTMPFTFYLEQISKGQMSYADIEEALVRNDKQLSTRNFLDRLESINYRSRQPLSLSALSDLVDEKSVFGFQEIRNSHTTDLLAAYFDGIASNMDSDSLFAFWRKQASVDLVPELKGINNFRKTVNDLPQSSLQLVAAFVIQNNISESFVESYLHALLLKLIGWSSYCAGIDWQNNLKGVHSTHVRDLLAILIAWEHMVTLNHPVLKLQWEQNYFGYSNFLSSGLDRELTEGLAILQDAYDIANRKKLSLKLGSYPGELLKRIDEHPVAQMIFCIDVRSEVYRRNLELVNPKIETIGFAGFFGLALNYKPLNHTKGKNQCPVLLSPKHEVKEVLTDDKRTLKIVKKKSVLGKLRVSWQGFKSGSLSSYAYVSPLGLMYLPKLLMNSLGLSKPVLNPKGEEFGKLIQGKSKLDLSGIPFTERVEMAYSALTAMDLKENFGRFVFIAGHGASSVNNPHSSGLDCGACGGNSGEVNALAIQEILNDDRVRKELKEMGCRIPSDTLFWACLHDTTTDEIKILQEDNIPASHIVDLKKLIVDFKVASKNTREIRASRFGIPEKDVHRSIFRKANNWAEVRPEWGLAGCDTFIIAPRNRTKGIDLKGKAFLHTYNWKSDFSFQVLETIMTAPMVVTSWINLQYYASTVDNEKLGAGNKILHNVTGGFGVLEGAGGDLRVGLPWQSVHDGNKFQHLPNRLNVVVEAPLEEINRIIQKHEILRNLFDNNWISVLVMNEEGVISHHYLGFGKWEQLAQQKDLVNK